MTRIYRLYLKPYKNEAAKNAIDLINNVIKDLDSKPTNSKTQSNGSYYSYINEDEDLKNVYKSMFIFMRSNFKLVIKGKLPIELLNNFVSLDVIRDGNSLKLVEYEVIEKNLS